MTESLTNEHKTTELKPDNTWKISNQWLERARQKERAQSLKVGIWLRGGMKGGTEAGRRGDGMLEGLCLWYSSILHIQNSLISFLISFPQILI